jgi:hypothetical protein
MRSTELGASKGSGDTTFKTAAHGTTWTKLQGGLKTPDSFWNLKTSVLAIWCFRTDHHHVQWCLEFSWNEAMVSATPHCRGGRIIKTESVTATRCGFSQHFQRCDAPGCNNVVLCELKWHQEGSEKESKPQGRPRSARSPDNVEWIRCHIAEYIQVSLTAISCTLLKWQQWLLNSPQGFALFSTYKLRCSGT